MGTVAVDLKVIWKMSVDGNPGRVLLAAWFFMIASAGPVLAECPPFPEVSWWKALSHQSARQYVAAKHGGDWNDYIDKWEKHYKRVKDIHDRKSAIVVTKDKIRVEGESLRSYIKKIRQRLEVIRCLAGTKTAAKAPASAAVSAVRKSDPKAGRKKANDAGCVKCHGKEGLSIYPAAPNLAGQNDLYIVKQLKEFQKVRPGQDAPYGTIERHNRMMDARAAALGETDVWNLAAFFSDQLCGSGAQGSSPAPRPAEAVPCIECHGVDGKSIFPEIPNLAGQKKVYLARQLKAFRTTAGHYVNRAKLKDERYHYLMAAQAKDLSDSEIDSLAGYFSSLACR